ncbi:MAG TPA: hypothetical protein VIH90_02400 [Candidatus Saccharimonadales bacterium]
MKLKFLFITLIAGLLFCVFLPPIHASATAYGTVDIIDDQVMNNVNTMSADQINNFLNNFTGTCLGTISGFATPDPQGYSNGAYQFGANTNAGTAIHDIAVHYNINPQVLLATLEKEQGLVDRNGNCSYSQAPAPAGASCNNPNGTGPTNCTYACQNSPQGGCVAIAMGYACPSYCRSDFNGFSKQISGASWVFRFAEARAYGQLSGYAGYDSGDEDICYTGPMTAGYRQRSAISAICKGFPGDQSFYYDGSWTDQDGNTMYISNGATASMLNYTPYYGRSYTSGSVFYTSFVKWFGSLYAYVYNGVSYKDVFDPTYYADNNPDVASVVGTDPMALFNHFVQYGMSEGRQASANFNVTSYLERYPDLRNAFHWNLPAYYAHYEQWGMAQGRIATGNYLGGTTVLNGADYSPVYSFDYYEKNYPAVANAFGLNDTAALQYFVWFDMSQGGQASSEFNVYDYMNRYPDLRWASGFGWNLPAYYMHYILYGKAEGRIANISGPTQYLTSLNGIDYSPVYDFTTYQADNPDVKNALGNNDLSTLQQFVQYGMSEGRQASTNFNVYDYMNRYPDLRAAFGWNLPAYYMHYILYGKAEGRIGS